MKNHLLLVKENLTIEQRDEIVNKINKYRDDVIVIFGENIEFHNLWTEEKTTEVIKTQVANLKQTR